MAMADNNNNSNTNSNNNNTKDVNSSRDGTGGKRKVATKHCRIE